MVTLMVVTPVRAHREALVLSFDTDPDLCVVYVAATLGDAVAGATRTQPAVTLVDFALAEVTTFLGALRRVAPGTRILGYGVGHASGAGQTVVSAARVGACGFVDVDQSLAEIRDAVRTVGGGEPYCSPRLAGLLLLALQAQGVGPPRNETSLADCAASALTGRERIVAELVVAGLTNREIASRLVLGEATVKSHVHSILHKLGVSRRTEVQRWLAQAR